MEGSRSACPLSCLQVRDASKKESLHASLVGSAQSASCLDSSVHRSQMEVGELLALWSLLIHHSSEAICSLDIVCTSLLFVHDSLFTAHLTSSLLTFSREIWAPFSPSFFPRKNRPEITPFFWVRKRGSSLWMSPRPSLNCDRKMALFLGPQSRRILNVAGQCVSPSVSIYFWIGR